MRSTNRLGVSNAFFIALIGGLAVVAGVFAWLYMGTLKTTADPGGNSERLAGSENPKPKTLDARFKDVDGDLLADAPTEKSKLVDPDTLVFSYISEKPEETKAQWKEFTDHLAKVTGKKVEFLLAPTATDEVRALVEGKLHVVGLNTGSVPMAVNRAGFIPAYTLGSPGTTAFIHSEIIVPADSPIQKPQDLRDHTIAFVDFNSNSGFKAPVVMLKTEFKMLPEKDYQFVVSYGHERSIEGIAHKNYEAAAVASDLLAHAVTAKTISPGQYRTIYSSESFPAVCIGYTYNLSPELVAKIRSAFETFQFKGTALEARFAPTQQDQFHAVNYKNDFKMVRLVDDQLGRPYELR